MTYANSADPDETADQGLHICHPTKYFKKQQQNKENTLPHYGWVYQ